MVDVKASGLAATQPRRKPDRARAGMRLACRLFQPTEIYQCAALWTSPIVTAKSVRSGWGMLDLGLELYTRDEMGPSTVLGRFSLQLYSVDSQVLVVHLEDGPVRLTSSVLRWKLSWSLMIAHTTSTVDVLVDGRTGRTFAPRALILPSTWQSGVVHPASEGSALAFPY
jgi:hypothetical protein